MSDDSNEKDDLTSIEDLKRFDHSEDEEVDLEIFDQDDIKLEAQNDSEDDFLETNSFETDSSISINEGSFPNTNLHIDEDSSSSIPNFESEDESSLSSEPFLNEDDFEDDNVEELTKSIEAALTDFKDNNEITEDIIHEQAKKSQNQLDNEPDSEEFVTQKKGEETKSIDNVDESTINEPELEALDNIKTLPSFIEDTKQNPIEEINEFANKIQYGEISSGGNPPFSVLIENVRFSEDVKDIIIILKEHKICDEENEQIYTSSLNNGFLLIPQISEYSAIYLAHKLRKYRLNISVGLSEELHPSNLYDNDQRGVVSRSTLTQNISESLDLSDQDILIEQIILTTTSQVHGHETAKYLGIISETSIMSEEDLRNYKIETYQDDTTVEGLQLTEVVDNEKLSKYSLTLGQIYSILAEKLRNKAYELKANAVTGIHFQITPLLEHTATSSKSLYNITCTGNAVWVTKI